MGMMQELKEFAVKGSVIDGAVGIVIGPAFGKIVNSLVNDIILPPMGHPVPRRVRRRDRGREGSPGPFFLALFRPVGDDRSRRAPAGRSLRTARGRSVVQPW
jgi:hypothetical protein